MSLQWYSAYCVVGNLYWISCIVHGSLVTLNTEDIYFSCCYMFNMYKSDVAAGSIVVVFVVFVVVGGGGDGVVVVAVVLVVVVVVVVIEKSK